jgi:TPR repeat protein
MGSIFSLFKKHSKRDLEKYYLAEARKESENAMLLLAHLYMRQGRLELAEEYYQKAAEKGNDCAMCNLGWIYYTRGAHEIAEKYYLMAIEKGNVYAMRNLGDMYEDQGRYKLARRYYIMAIEKGHEAAMYSLRRMLTNKLELYCILTRLQSNEIIKDMISEMKSTKAVHCYENKKIFLSKDGECPICLENKKLIPLECTHYYCCDCYVEMNKCAICRF